MMLKSKTLPVTIAVLIGIGGATVAFADEDEQDSAREIAAVMAAKISLTQAIAAAEQQSGGKAIQAGFDHEDGKRLFEIEVAKGQAVQKVFVDGDTGQIVTMARKEQVETEED